MFYSLQHMTICAYWLQHSSKFSIFLFKMIMLRTAEICLFIEQHQTDNSYLPIEVTEQPERSYPNNVPAKTYVVRLGLHS